MNRTVYADDCLNVLNDEIEIESNSIDLIYLDPPFNSKSNYTLPFKAKDKTTKPIDVFVDTWDWDEKEVSYMETLEKGMATKKIHDLISLVRSMESPRAKYSTSAYLVNMAVRLIPMKRALKETGSIYLHCDPTASHYLKMIMDMIFGPKNFRNEITWKRTTAHNDAAVMGMVHDVILFYTKSKAFTWNKVYIPHTEKYIKSKYRHKEPDGRRFMDDNLTAKGLTGGGYEYEYRGKENLWRVPLSTMERLDRENRLYFTRTGGIRIKRYLDEMDGVALSDVWNDIDDLWDDIDPVNSQALERYGYPTQKPMDLLNRIVKASSNEGDLILDPFCGCGTTIHAAEANGRQWIGIDISHFSAGLMHNRIISNFDNLSSDDIRTAGVPDTPQAARELAKRDKFAFEKWVCGHVGAEGMFHDPGTKGADGGVDGVLKFVPIRMGEKPKEEYAIVQVKGGNVTPDAVRALSETIDRFNAKAGIIICFNDQMRTVENNRSKRLFRDSMGEYPVIQGLSVEDMLEDKKLNLPAVLKKAA